MEILCAQWNNVEDEGEMTTWVRVEDSLKSHGDEVQTGSNIRERDLRQWPRLTKI